LKLLLDTCVWGLASNELREEGHDVEWAGDWPVDPGDQTILARAHGERRVLVTLDKDFGELAVLRGTPHSGIIRLVNLAPEDQVRHCLLALDRHGPDLLRGAIVTVEYSRIRFRPPP